MTTRLAGRVAVITGAASGIGAAAVARFAAEGAKIAALDRDAAGAERELELAGASGVALACDVTDEAAVKTAIGDVVQHLGRIDLLVACAGHPGPVAALADVDEADWDNVFDVNVKGVWLCAKHAIRAMQPTGGGCIAIMASDSSYVASPGIGAYCASKGAVLMLVRALATDYGQFGIRTNCVSPSIADTPMPRLTLGIGDGDFRQAGVEDWHTADEIAGHLLYLCCDESRGLNGSSIIADFGGMAKSTFPV